MHHKVVIFDWSSRVEGGHNEPCSSGELHPKRARSGLSWLLASAVDIKNVTWKHSFAVWIFMLPQHQPCAEAERCTGGCSWFCAAADSDALVRPVPMERDVLPLLQRGNIQLTLAFCVMMNAFFTGPHTKTANVRRAKK